MPKQAGYTAKTNFFLFFILFLFLFLFLFLHNKFVMSGHWK